MESKYYLTHVTTEENCQNIVKTNNFNISKHTKDSIQWLGDGIYFWSANDKDAINIGKKLVKGKKENKSKNTKNISIKFSIDEERHMNLESDRWETKFISYARKIYPDDDTLLRILEANKQQANLSTRELNEVGKIFGDCINSFLNVLDVKFKIKVDLVSHYFYHKRKMSKLFGREELCYRQFCIKDPRIVNDISSEKWDIE